MAVELPTFELPHDGNDTGRYELWTIRAPSNLNIQEMFDGVTVEMDSNLLRPHSNQSNTTLTMVKSKIDDKEYTLALSGPTESSCLDTVKLLLPCNNEDDEDKSKMKPCDPFGRHVSLACPSSIQISGGASSGNALESSNLLLAPSKDRAPEPAFGKKENGSVDSMRIAYAPVAKKGGLKRRWAIPGSETGAKKYSELSSRQSSLEKKEKISGGTAEGAGRGSAVVSISDEGGKKKRKKKKTKK